MDLLVWLGLIVHSVIQPDTALVSVNLAFGSKGFGPFVFVAAISSLSTLFFYFVFSLFFKLEQIENWLSGKRFVHFSKKTVLVFGYFGLSVLCLIPFFGFRHIALSLSLLWKMKWGIFFILFFHNLRLYLEMLLGKEILGLIYGLF